MLFVVMVVAVAMGVITEARYAPTRDHNPDWMALISGKQQFKDARILYSLLNNDPELTSMEKREMVGFDSSERVFEGFQHPFYYHQRQLQSSARDPVLFSRLSAMSGGMPASRGSLAAIFPRQAPESPSHPHKDHTLPGTA